MKFSKPFEIVGYMVAGANPAPFYGWSLTKRDLVAKLKAKGIIIEPGSFYRIAKVRISEVGR